MRVTTSMAMMQPTTIPGAEGSFLMSSDIKDCEIYLWEVDMLDEVGWKRWSEFAR